MKTCRVCGVTKPLDAYYKAANNADGYKNQCIECKRLESRAYRADNAQKIKLQKDTWRKANPEKVRGHARKFTAEQIQRYSRSYYERNRHRYAARDIARRARTEQATPPWADTEAIRAIYAEAGRRIAAGEQVHVDHIIPLCGLLVCGLHVHGNLRIVPARVNLSKGASFDEALALHGEMRHSANLTAEHQH